MIDIDARIWKQTSDVDDICLICVPSRRRRAAIGGSVCEVRSGDSSIACSISNQPVPIKILRHMKGVTKNKCSNLARLYLSVDVKSTFMVLE